MSAQNILVPYEDYNQILKDSETLANVKALLATEFPDDTCQMIAIKSLLGIAEEEPNDPGTTDPGTTDPSDPDTSDPGNTTP